jgi:hypothetical protein
VFLGDADFFLSISSLVFLEKLHFNRFSGLGMWPGEMAAALHPLHDLRALVRLRPMQC